jgi:hypothetical protein
MFADRCTVVTCSSNASHCATAEAMRVLSFTSKMLILLKGKLCQHSSPSLFTFFTEMDPSPEQAALQEQVIASIAGSVGVALIASFLELTEFFVLSSCMFLMLSVPPLLQWILCDEPPLDKRDELLSHVIPCLCFMVTYALPGLVALAICRTASMVAYVWDMVIWHLTTRSQASRNAGR